MLTEKTVSEVLRPPQLQLDEDSYFDRDLGQIRRSQMVNEMGAFFGTVSKMDPKFEAYLLQAVNDYGACIDALRQLVIPYEGCAADPLISQAYKLISDFDKLARK